MDLPPSPIDPLIIKPSKAAKFIITVHFWHFPQFHYSTMCRYYGYEHKTTLPLLLRRHVVPRQRCVLCVHTGRGAYLSLIVLGKVVHLWHIDELDEVTWQGRSHVTHSEVSWQRESGTSCTLGLTITFKYLEPNKKLM